MAEQVISRGVTADGKHIILWADGSLTWALGYAIRGAWMKPKPAKQEEARRAGWLLLGDAVLYDAAEIPDLVKAARWAVARDATPGAMRQRFKTLRQPKPILKPVWITTRADRNGKPTERWWRLPRLGSLSGTAVLDNCSTGRRGRYEIAYLVGKNGNDETYRDSGISFATLGETITFLAERIAP
jgi:hypothetical protein